MRGECLAVANSRVSPQCRPPVSYYTVDANQWPCRMACQRVMRGCVVFKVGFGKKPSEGAKVHTRVDVSYCSSLSVLFDSSCVALGALCYVLSVLVHGLCARLRTALCA